MSIGPSEGIIIFLLWRQRDAIKCHPDGRKRGNTIQGYRETVNITYKEYIYF